MKISDLYRVNSTKGYLFSVFVHGVLIFALATATVKLAVPEGDVFDTEVDYSGPGSLGTPVDVVETPVPQPKVEPPPQKKEAPQEIKKEVAKPVPVPVSKPVVKTETSDEAPSVEVDKKGWLPVEETDIDDGQAHGKSSDEAETSGEAEKEPEVIAQALPQEGADAEEDGDGGGTPPGTPSGEVHSDKELVARKGNPKPNYPMFSRLKREQGTVVLRFTVNDDGEVDKVWLHQSSGHKALDNEALNSHKHWRYEPGRTGIFQKQVTFSLKGQAVEVPYQKK
ncbi:MAG: energy transducer TonB [Bdellovibrionales bacterium]